jgi:hypothetical protein
VVGARLAPGSFSGSWPPARAALLTEKARAGAAYVYCEMIFLPDNLGSENFYEEELRDIDPHFAHRPVRQDHLEIIRATEIFIPQSYAQCAYYDVNISALQTPSGPRTEELITQLPVQVLAVQIELHNT